MSQITKSDIKSRKAAIRALPGEAALVYQPGFGNHFVTESVPGALPVGRNSPHRPPYGLYAEQISGTSFTTARAENRRTWTYRIRPSVVHRPYARIDNGMIRSAPFNEVDATPTQLRWSPLPIPQKPADFVEGIDDCTDTVWVECHGMKQPLLVNAFGQGDNVGNIVSEPIADHEVSGLFKVPQD